MALALEVWEDSGIIGSPGSGPSVRHEVDNLGFKNSPLDETYSFANYPIGRPVGGSPAERSYSYKKYYYFKFSGTYASNSLNSVVISLDGSPETTGGSPLITDGSGVANNVSIVYAMTNVYEEPDNLPLVGTTYDYTLPPLIVPNLSTTDPRNATSIINPVTDTTYYTNYIVMQLVVEPSGGSDYGNLNSELELRFAVNERKSGLSKFAGDYLTRS